MAPSQAFVVVSAFVVVCILGTVGRMDSAAVSAILSGGLFYSFGHAAGTRGRR